MSAMPTYPIRSHGEIFLSAIWVWLRYCLSSMGLVGRLGQGAEDFCIPMPSGRNRASRNIHRHFKKRAHKGVIPPARTTAPFRKFGPRHVSPTQFMERCCRLSTWGRVDIYAMVYYAHRLNREAIMARKARFATRQQGEPYARVMGLWRAHFWPS